MNRFYFAREKGGKLVRDKITEINIAQKHGIKERLIGKEALSKAIIGKFSEELTELEKELQDGNVEAEKKEVADLMTLINSYVEVRGFDRAEIEQIEKAKTEKVGAFTRGSVIEYIDLNPEGDEYDLWLNHFREVPDKNIEGESDE